MADTTPPEDPIFTDPELISLEQIERGQKFLAIRGMPYALYSESDLNDAEKSVVSDSHYYQEVASSSEVTAAAMKQVRRTVIGSKEFTERLLSAGYVRTGGRPDHSLLPEELFDPPHGTYERPSSN